jgi:hypothetical protein
MTTYQMSLISGGYISLDSTSTENNITTLFIP